MDQRYIDKAIERNHFRTFAGASFLIPRDSRLTMDWLIGRLNFLRADLRRVTPEEAGDVVGIVDTGPAGISVRFVLVLPPQSNLIADSGGSLEENDFRVLELKVATIVEMALASIAVGKKLAREANQRRLHVEDIHRAVEKGPDERVARGAASRERGKPQDIEFSSRNLTLGANFDIPTQYQ